jgi:hypothetical protein
VLDNPNECDVNIYEKRTISRKKNPELAQLIDILDSLSLSLSTFVWLFMFARTNIKMGDINVHYGVNMAYSHMLYVLISHKCVVQTEQQ